MGNNDNNDLDDELVRSIEKLVEEETNVAKAFVDNSTNPDRADKTYSIDRRAPRSGQDTSHSTAVHTDDEFGATRMIDAAKLEGAVKTSAPKAVASRTAGVHDKGAEVSKSASSDKKIVSIAVSVVVAAVVVIIIAAVVIHFNNKKSYDYNYSKGMEAYESGDMAQALVYFENAFDTSEGRKNVTMMNLLADIYISDGDYDSAVTVLKSVLEYDVGNTDALEDLGGIYYSQGKGSELTALIDKYDGSKASSALDAYKVDEPSPSEVPGTLAEPVELTLMASDGCSIYYTTDGSEPTTNSTVYLAPIKIEKDTVTIKAVAVNRIGVTSKTAVMKYTVSLQAPSAAELSIDGSSISEGTVILITNLEEGCKAYYTVDGTTPTANSIIYNDGIDLTAGSYVLSVVIINKSNLSSPITRKNITVEAGKNYTYAEAQGILLARMRELNIIGSNGKFSVGGQTPEFVYQSKTTVDGIEMYYIRIDIKENSTTEGYYGVGVNNGKCYRITGSGSSAKAVEY